MGHLADEETEAKVIVIKRQNYESSLCFCMHPYSHPDCLPHSDPALHQEKAPGRASPSRRSPMDKRYRTNCKWSEGATGYPVVSMTFAMASEKQGLECFSYPLHLPALPPPPGLMAHTFSDLLILLHAGMLHFAHAYYAWPTLLYSYVCCLSYAFLLHSESLHSTDAALVITSSLGIILLLISKDKQVYINWFWK